MKRRFRLDVVVMAALGVALGGVLSVFVAPALRRPSQAEATGDATGAAAGLIDPTASGPGAGQASPAAVPKLLTNVGGGAGGGVELDPRAPGYDPTAFSEVTPLREIFAKEPRNEAWAGPLEGYLSGKIEKELGQAFAGLRLKNVECRTGLCKIAFEPGEGQAVNRMKLQQMLQLLYSPAAGGLGEEPFSFVMAFRGRIQWLRSVPVDDPRALFTALEQRRAKMIASLQQHQANGTPRTSFQLVDLNELPRE
jgi:hypothetical protein